MAEDKIKDRHAQSQEILQDLLGLSALASSFGPAVTQGILGALANREHRDLLISTFCAEMVNSFKSMLKDADVRGALIEIGTGIFSNERVIGNISEGVYEGIRRGVEDEKVHHQMAQIGDMVVGSQKVTNMVNGAVNTAATRQREFFKSEEFKKVFSEAAQSQLAMLQEIINVSIMEGIESLKTTKLEGTFSLKS